MSHRCRFPYCLLLLVLLHAVSASAEWKEKVLYNLQNDPDGKWPAGGDVFGKDGSLYGATIGGGGDLGTVFQLSWQGKTWTETVLHSFNGKPQNDGDGDDSGLVVDKQGNLYGVTSTGGAGNCTVLGDNAGCGVVYEMSPPTQKGGKWTETILYSFHGGNDGNLPIGDLIFDQVGNLYGATWFGGGGGGSSCNPYYQYCGTIFELSPPKQKGGTWKEKVLYSFKNGPDGGQPNGGLVFDKHGALYGTTYCGGVVACQNGLGGSGVVFRLRQRKGRGSTFGIVHSFNNVDGFAPVAGLLLRKGGGFYGTTISGGKYSSGDVFALEPPSQKGGKWRVTVLYSFTDGSDGNGPNSVLVFDRAGNLYGTARSGVIYRLQPERDNNKWNFAVIYDFTGAPDGDDPIGVIVDHAGDLYGTTQYGGSSQNCGDIGCGTVYEVSPK